MGSRLIAIAALLLVAGCASPREKAYKTALKEYQRANQATVEFARAETKKLVTTCRGFLNANARWPTSFDELASFAAQNRLTFDTNSFNDVQFAELSDGTLQIHYDVNCSRFNTMEHKFSQTGALNVKRK